MRSLIFAAPFSSAFARLFSGEHRLPEARLRSRIAIRRASTFIALVLVGIAGLLIPSEGFALTIDSVTISFHPTKGDNLQATGHFSGLSLSEATAVTLTVGSYSQTILLSRFVERNQIFTFTAKKHESGLKKLVLNLKKQTFTAKAAGISLAESETPLVLRLVAGVFDDCSRVVVTEKTKQWIFRGKKGTQLACDEILPPSIAGVTLYGEPSSELLVSYRLTDGSRITFQGLKDSDGVPTEVTALWMLDPALNETAILFDSDGRPRQARGPSGDKFSFVWLSDTRVTMSVVTPDGAQVDHTFDLPSSAGFATHGRPGSSAFPAVPHTDSTKTAAAASSAFVSVHVEECDAPATDAEVTVDVVPASLGDLTYPGAGHRLNAGQTGAGVYRAGFANFPSDLVPDAVRSLCPGVFRDYVEPACKVTEALATALLEGQGCAGLLVVPPPLGEALVAKCITVAGLALIACTPLGAGTPELKCSLVEDILNFFDAGGARVDVHVAVPGHRSQSKSAHIPASVAETGFAFTFECLPGTAHVSVVNAVDGLPVPGATVTIGSKQGTTGANGSVSIEDLPPKSPLAVTVTATGYESGFTSVTPVSGETVSVQVVLQPKFSGPFVASGTFHCSGTFFPPPRTGTATISYTGTISVTLVSPTEARFVFSNATRVHSGCFNSIQEWNFDLGLTNAEGHWVLEIHAPAGSFYFDLVVAQDGGSIQGTYRDIPDWEDGSHGEVVVQLNIPRVP